MRHKKELSFRKECLLVVTCARVWSNILEKTLCYDRFFVMSHNNLIRPDAFLALSKFNIATMINYLSI